MFKKIVGSVILAGLAMQTLAGKIVIFDHEEALLRTQVAQQKIDKLKSKPEYAQMLANAESMKADLEALTKDANSKGMTWSTEERAENRKKMEYIQADLKLAAQKLQGENSAVIQDIVNEMQPKLETVLTKLVESGEVDIVLRKQASYIAKPSSDITDKVTAELDKLK